jgi:hypothetical protein
VEGRREEFRVAVDLHAIDGAAEFKKMAIVG